MTDHRSRIDKVAARADVYELVRFAHTYPGDDPAIDAALAQIVPRLASKEKSHDLSHVLTLPARTATWTAVDAAIEALVAMGPEVNQAVVSVALGGSLSAKERVARVLEGTGDQERAAKLREELGRRSPDLLESSTAVPALKTPPSTGFRVFAFLLLAVGAVTTFYGVRLLTWGVQIGASADPNGDYYPLLGVPAGVFVALVGMSALAAGIGFLVRLKKVGRKAG